jgi:hypothetical protein
MLLSYYVAVQVWGQRRSPKLKNLGCSNARQSQSHPKAQGVTTGEKEATVELLLGRENRRYLGNVCFIAVSSTMNHIWSHPGLHVMPNQSLTALNMTRPSRLKYGKILPPVLLYCLTSWVMVQRCCVSYGAVLLPVLQHNQTAWVMVQRRCVSYGVVLPPVLPHGLTAWDMTRPDSHV